MRCPACRARRQAPQAPAPAYGVLDAAMPTLHNPLSCVMSARARKRLVGIADKRANTAQRQALATRALAGLKLVRHPASYFIWLPLGDD